MIYLDLSSGHLAAWRAKLTRDVQDAVPDDADPAVDAAAAALVADLQVAAPGRVAEVVAKHVGVVNSLGRARRMRLMSWVVNRSWPDTGPARDLMSDEEGDSGDGSRSGQGGGARARIAPLFREDFLALAAVARHLVRSSAKRMQTIQDLHAGIKDFSESPEFPAGGIQ